MMRAMWVVAVIVSACRTPEPASSGTVTVKAEQCSDEQWAVAELAALKTNIKRDPVTAMGRLGVDVEGFESIAKALYQHWTATHPQARPAAKQPPPVVDDTSTRPRKFENGTLVVSVDHWFWCFTSRKAGIDWCASTRELCEHYKSADDGGCTPTDEMTCYHTKVEGQERDAGWCFKTVANCKMGMLAWPGPEQIVLGCTTLRYSGAKK